MTRLQLARSIARPLSITATSTIPQQAHRIIDNRFDFQRRNGSSKAAKDIAPIAHPASLADVKPNNLVDYALQLGPNWLPLAIELRSGLLQYRNDARFNATLRPRPSRHHLPRLP
ncbi:hypothetical protein FOXB_09435 [Fusarium oxysporum f. sp. conglutinans Fo5176]|uniref:Uncharacterized protein n=1 Tax=Fusarium oxysporum (strain Fo5176) TaxID=660025 RepID=F9FSQ4_FUSOF|nr:hypothetical protein FOXB_09435 [Fusarium oxysporum f. sp. conglutinans Fo5176]